VRAPVQIPEDAEAEAASHQGKMAPNAGVLVSAFLDEEGGHLLLRTFPKRRHLFATMFPWYVEHAGLPSDHQHR
jgi:hypothetical protein